MGNRVLLLTLKEVGFNIDFKSAEKSVKKLQKRIYVAYSRNDIDKMMYLQSCMIHSFYAKALAVKIVTSNRGKKYSRCR